MGFHLLSSAARVETGGDNIRLGNLKLDLRGSLTQAYDSNIGLSPSDPQADWITQIGIRLGGEVDLTEINTLRLSIGAEYRKYWHNPQYDSDKNFIILTPETGLEFLFQVGNFDFRLYDDFSLLSDPGDQRFIDPNSGAQLTNIVLYNRIRNRVGIDGIWTINPYWSANAGVSRLDIVPLDSEFRDLQRHSYIGSVGLTHNMAANLDVYGLVSTSIDRWRTNFQPNSSSWSTGAGANWQPTDFLESEVFLAWTHRSFSANGTNQDPTRDAQGVTGNISLTHLINPILQHSIRYGRNIDLGSVSNDVAVQFAEYRIDYSGFERSDIFVGVLWNEGAESGGVSPERYNRWAFRTGLGYPLSRQLAFSAFLEHTFRDSNLPSRNFSRNLASVTLTYDF